MDHPAFMDFVRRLWIHCCWLCYQWGLSPLWLQELNCHFSNLPL